MTTGDLWRQFDVLGAGEARGGRYWEKKDLSGERTWQLMTLTRATKREIVSHLLIRRVTYLDVGGEQHTKNMYRREWRLRWIPAVRQTYPI